MGASLTNAFGRNDAVAAGRILLNLKTVILVL